MKPTGASFWSTPDWAGLTSPTLPEPAPSSHVFRAEMEAALNPGIREKLRYIQAQWAHGPDWVPYQTSGDEWFGFEAVRAIEGLDRELVIVPLAGHSRGHSAIAVRDGERWLMHCGDSYFHHGEIATPPEAPRGLKIFEAVTEIDGRQRRANQERLRELAARHGGPDGAIEMFCAHDPSELERLATA